ncbi:MAG TPA: hypothetical protein VHL98_22615 [Microvirga sp.]|jgi:hypothetical protein|nr:hypothetical protein [Microvirga sp.]
MSGSRNREEVVNTQLALLISTMGVDADAETIHNGGRDRPDVLFELRGLRVIIEGKFADHQRAEAAVLEDARRRVRSGLAHIAAAAIYPSALRSCPTSQIGNGLLGAQLRYRIVSETAESPAWFEGDPAALMGALRRAQEALVEDDIVEQTAASLAMRLEAVAGLWSGQPGACDRLSRLLGITIPDDEAPATARDRRETAAKISALVLANAYIFQEQLNPTDERVVSLRELAVERDLLRATSERWTWIWQNINYVAVFQLGARVLEQLPSNQNTLTALRALLAEAAQICARQAALRHDLMGRIYHRLLHDAKYLGTFYTAVPSATLLLQLAFALDWPQDFGSPRELASFKVADLACGTGTLLMATAQALSDRYIRARAQSGRSLTRVDLKTLHRTLMENVLHGYDVLPSAVHLTASTLAMLAPEVAFVRMNLYAMPMGVDRGDIRLGSLDFLATDHVKTQMALDDTQAETLRIGASGARTVDATVPKLDLCVMNPPFTRSVGGNLLFGSLPEPERKRLQAELRAQIQATRISANSTAGLGSVFVALADRRLKPGGRLAFVLPAALASGEAWGATRRLVADRYHLETVIASHDPERPNFSESTNLSEVMFVARKRGRGEGAAETLYVNLHRNPRSIHEALDLAIRIARIREPAALGGRGTTAVRADGAKLGEAVRAPAPQGAANWSGALFAQTELLRAWWSLHEGGLLLPGTSRSFPVPLRPLIELGTLGHDQRDIHDAFSVSHDEYSAHAAFWGNASGEVRCIAQAPNAWLHPLLRPHPGRRLKDHAQVWGSASTILLAERLRFTSHRVVAVGFEEAVLGNSWWALRLAECTPKQRKALLLWLNSTPAILLYFASRVITEGAWVKMKKPAWAAMPVLDVRGLDRDQVQSLAGAYDRLASRSLKAVAQLADDPGRAAIDAALSEALNLPNLASLRQMLARESGLTARRAPGARAARREEEAEHEVEAEDVA